MSKRGKTTRTNADIIPPATMRLMSDIDTIPDGERYNAILEREQIERDIREVFGQPIMSVL